MKKSIFNYTNYREFLQAHLEEVQKRNAAFSLRSYARQLGVAASYLSEVLSGKKNLSLAKAAVLSKKLQLDTQAQQFFLKLVQASDEKNKAALDIMHESLEKLQRPLTRTAAEESHFKILLTWYLIPVLEMLVSQKYNGKIKDISDVLGVSPQQVTEAVEQLEALHVIESLPDGRWKKTSNHLILSSEKHNKALKKFHSNLIEKYQRALYDQSPQTRYSGSETILIDPTRLCEAQKIMNECLDKIVSLMACGENRTEPYHLHIGMFSLRQKKMSSKEEAS